MVLRAWVDNGSVDVFVRNRIRVNAAYEDPGKLLVFTQERNADGDLFEKLVDVRQNPDVRSDEEVRPVLDVPEDIARAIYVALREKFEGEAGKDAETAFLRQQLQDTTMALRDVTDSLRASNERMTQSASTVMVHGMDLTRDAVQVSRELARQLPVRPGNLGT